MTPAATDAIFPVVVLGTGPVGLAGIARLVERDIEALLSDAADSVGARLLDFGHVRLFSHRRYDIDPAMAAMLARTGWQAPPAEELPSARAL